MPSRNSVGAEVDCVFLIGVIHCIHSKKRVMSMAVSNILTVRMNEADLSKLDELAKLQNRPRSQLVQDAVRELIRASDELAKQEFLRIKARLAPAVKAQCDVSGRSSVADEHCRF